MLLILLENQSLYYPSYLWLKNISSNHIQYDTFKFGAYPISRVKIA